jgi:hypothetical protein
MSGGDRARAGLHARTVDALDELRRLQCHDPAAAHAMRVVRLTARTLADFWLPALDRKRSEGEPGDHP